MSAVWKVLVMVSLSAALFSGSASATTLTQAGSLTIPDELGGQISLTTLVPTGPTVSVSIMGDSGGFAAFGVVTDVDTSATSLSFLFDGDSLTSDATATVMLPGLLAPVVVDANAAPVMISGVMLAADPADTLVGLLNVIAIEFSDIDGEFTFLTSVTAVPLPAAAWLFLSALGGLLVARRHRLVA